MLERLVSGIQKRLIYRKHKSRESTSIRTRVVHFDPAQLQESGLLDSWSDWIFTMHGAPSSVIPEDEERFKAAREQLRDMTKKITKGAATIEHIQSATPWHDEGAGVQATADDRLIVTYTDGSQASMHWNAGELAGRFPNVNLEATGKIRQVLEESFPEALLEGPVATQSQVFHPFRV